jgi:hypothetical protein
MSPPSLASLRAGGPGETLATPSLSPPARSLLSSLPPAPWRWRRPPPPKEMGRATVDAGALSSARAGSAVERRRCGGGCCSGDGGCDVRGGGGVGRQLRRPPVVAAAAWARPGLIWALWAMIVTRLRWLQEEDGAMVLLARSWRRSGLSEADLVDSRPGSPRAWGRVSLVFGPLWSLDAGAAAPDDGGGFESAARAAVWTGRWRGFRCYTYGCGSACSGGGSVQRWGARPGGAVWLRQGMVVGELWRAWCGSWAVDLGCSCCAPSGEILAPAWPELAMVTPAGVTDTSLTYL